MRSKYMFICLMLTIIVGLGFAPSAMAMDGDDLFFFTLLFGVISLFAFWIASVLILFGMSYLTAMLAGYLILGASILAVVIAPEVVPNLKVDMHPDDQLKSNPEAVLGMNLS